jgi:omega-amidase
MSAAQPIFIVHTNSMSTLHLSLIQADLRWQDKPANLSMLEDQIRPLAGKTELVILPEMFNTGFCLEPDLMAEEMDGPTVGWMKKLAADCRIILTGSLIIREDGHYFNRLIWMLPNGQYGWYDKRHRFAFAGEDRQFTAGTKRLIAAVKGWRVNLQVCYDLRFPVWARQTLQNGEPEFDLLIYVANWPERRSHAWETLLQARAIENQCYVAGVNRVGNDGNGIYHKGDSMVIDPLGSVLIKQQETAGVFSIEIDKKTLAAVREKMPFWKDADQFNLLP